MNLVVTVNNAMNTEENVTVCEPGCHSQQCHEHGSKCDPWRPDCHSKQCHELGIERQRRVNCLIVSIAISIREHIRVSGLIVNDAMGIRGNVKISGLMENNAMDIGETAGEGW